jgi:glycosyltransferase involved in cell wall biosynthesis
MINRPLNVIRIISFLPIGGVENTLLTTLPLFDKNRFNISVCCTYRKGPIADRLEEKGIPVHLCRVASRLHPIHLWRLSRWLKENKADIVHTHMYSSNISGVIAARLAHIPVIISHIHSTHEWKSWNRILMERLVDRFRTGAIAVSQYVKNLYLQKTGLACENKIRVLHNIARFSQKSIGDKAHLRRESGLPPEGPVVGTVARLVPLKGVDIFIRAAAEVWGRRQDVSFVIVGEGKERRRLETMAEGLGLKRCLFFAGERQNIADFYDLFDIFVLSSRSEGFGIVILEAMHHDIPVIAAAVGGVPEIVINDMTGILVPTESPQSLAEAIISLLDNPEKGRRLVEEARKRLELFTVERYVETLENYYEELWERAMRR